MTSQILTRDDWRVDYAAAVQFATKVRPQAGFRGSRGLIATPTRGARVSGAVTVLAAALFSGGYIAQTSPAAAMIIADAPPQATYAVTFRRKQSMSAPERLADIRLRLGITWGEVARVFDVSRRAVHTWASGGKLSSIHDAQLSELHAKVVSATDLSVIKRDYSIKPKKSLDEKFMLKAAVLSSDELGVSSPAIGPTRRIDVAKLRRR